MNSEELMSDLKEKAKVASKNRADYMEEGYQDYDKTIKLIRIEMHSIMDIVLSSTVCSSVRMRENLGIPGTSKVLDENITKTVSEHSKANLQAYIRQLEIELLPPRGQTHVHVGLTVAISDMFNQFLDNGYRTIDAVAAAMATENG